MFVNSEWNAEKDWKTADADGQNILINLRTRLFKGHRNEVASLTLLLVDNRLIVSEQAFWLADTFSCFHNKHSLKPLMLSWRGRTGMKKCGLWQIGKVLADKQIDCCELKSVCLESNQTPSEGKRISKSLKTRSENLHLGPTNKDLVQLCEPASWRRVCTSLGLWELS